MRVDARPGTWLRKTGSEEEAPNRKRDRDESENEREWQRAGDAHTVANPQTSQVENVSLIWGATSPVPKIKVAGVTGSMNVHSAL